MLHYEHASTPKTKSQREEREEGKEGGRGGRGGGRERDHEITLETFDHNDGHVQRDGNQGRKLKSEGREGANAGK